MHRKKDIQKIAFEKFFEAFAVWHKLFLKELASKYKELGRFPFIPLRELASCYQNKRDMEVAALAGLLIKNNEKAERRIREFRIMFGESPWEWFRTRQFSVLPSGKEHGDTTGGINNWKIAEYFDYIYNNNKGSLQFIPTLSIILASAVGKNNYYYLLHLLRMILSTSDGMGLGIWKIDPSKLKCPESKETKDFLCLWLQDSCKYGSLFTFDEGVKLMGMDRDIDFFYAYLGWKELCRTNPKECSRYATIYNKRYSERNLICDGRWVNTKEAIVPKVVFE